MVTSRGDRDMTIGDVIGSILFAATLYMVAFAIAVVG